MKIIIVRHAQTDENVDGLAQNASHNVAGEALADRDSQVLMNAEGVKQAQKLGEHLKGENIAVAYTSPQHRAVHTVKEALRHHPGAQILPAEALKEQSLGIYDGAKKAEWKAIKKLSKEPFHVLKTEGGESYAELQNRAKHFFHQVLAKHPHETILIVSHGGTLGVLLLHILEKELTEENYRAHQPKNAEVSIIEIDGDGKKHIHKLNSREHLN